MRIAAIFSKHNISQTHLYIPAVEPAWHRRRQQQRSAARKLLKAADALIAASAEVPSHLVTAIPKAIAHIQGHHGSEVPKRVLDWLHMFQGLGCVNEDGRQSPMAKRVALGCGLRNRPRNTAGLHATEEDARHGSAGIHLPTPNVPVAFDGALTSWKQRTREGATFEDTFPRSPERKEEAKAKEARPALTRAKVARARG